MPTTINKTVGPGKDYASLSALEAANRNLVSNDEVWIVTCDNFEDTTGSITFTGWVTDATRYLHIKAADKHLSNGRVTTSAYRLSVNQAGFPISMNNMGAGGLVIFEGLQFKNPNAGGGCILGGNAGVVYTCRFVDCVFEAGCCCIRQTQTTSCDFQFINCWGIADAYNASYPGAIYFTKRNLQFYNCTFIYLGNSGIGVELYTHAAPTKEVVNCYFAAPNNGAAVTFNGTNMTRKEKCATDDASGDVPSVAYSVANFVGVTGGSENLHLAAGSALIGVADSLEDEPAPFNFTTDIDGHTRNPDTPDIGADEQASYSAVVTPTVTGGAQNIMLAFTEAETLATKNCASAASNPQPANYLDVLQILKRVPESTGEFRTVRV